MRAECQAEEHGLHLMGTGELLKTFKGERATRGGPWVECLKLA